MQSGLPGPGSILIKIRGYVEDRAVFSTHCETTHSEQGFLSNWQPEMCRGSYQHKSSLISGRGYNDGKGTLWLARQLMEASLWLACIAFQD